LSCGQPLVREQVLAIQHKYAICEASKKSEIKFCGCSRGMCLQSLKFTQQNLKYMQRNKKDKSKISSVSKDKTQHDMGCKKASCEQPQKIKQFT
jgi:hypothetical protein